MNARVCVCVCVCVSVCVCVVCMCVCGCDSRVIASHGWSVWRMLTFDLWIPTGKALGFLYILWIQKILGERCVCFRGAGVEGGRISFFPCLVGWKIKMIGMQLPLDRKLHCWWIGTSVLLWLHVLQCSCDYNDLGDHMGTDTTEVMWVQVPQWSCGYRYFSCHVRTGTSVILLVTCITVIMW